MQEKWKIFVCNDVVYPQFEISNFGHLRDSQTLQEINIWQAMNEVWAETRVIK